jgi:quercetin dioxygenase-like cupin family protein
MHRHEDEVFHVLEGDLRFLVSGKVMRARAGQTLIVPKGSPHTYRVELLMERAG